MARYHFQSNISLLLHFIIFLLNYNHRFFTSAHPGGVADGRATCGIEYSIPETAYEIPDIKEAWYLRRISTCASPVFWTKFDISKENQRIYVAVISPALERFEDELQFHAILYGPGVVSSEKNGLSDIPDTLPPGIDHHVDLRKGGSAYVTRTSYESCDFVDTNEVMKRFSDVIDGRCMEEFYLDDDYKDPLQQDTTSYSWWLYSYNHRAAEPGTYYLQTWLTSRDDVTTTAQGKYEITLAPWSWKGYASEATLDLAQSQGTSCSCAMNALDYKESYLDRLGDLDPALQISQLPGGSCSTYTDSHCVTIPQEPYLSVESAVEWSGVYVLKPDRIYEWTFHAYYQGANYSSYAYPDPGMYVYVHVLPANNDDIDSVAALADTILTSAVQDNGDLSPSMLLVKDGEMLDLEKDESQFVLFEQTDKANSTTVLLPITFETTTRLAVFTQHVPSEFMAHFLRDSETGENVFPVNPTLYVNKNEALMDNEDSSTNTEEPGLNAMDQFWLWIKDKNFIP